MIDRAGCWEVGICWTRRIVDCWAHEIQVAVQKKVGSQARLADTKSQLQVLELEYSLVREPRLSPNRANGYLSTLCSTGGVAILLWFDDDH